MGLLPIKRNILVLLAVAVLAVPCAPYANSGEAKNQDDLRSTPTAEAPQSVPDNELQARITALIAQLAAEKLEDRDAAQEALLDIGEDARQSLVEAEKSSDPEIVDRAKKILSTLNMPRVTIVCEDFCGKPLADRDVSVRTGNAFRHIRTGKDGVAVVGSMESSKFNNGGYISLDASIEGYSKVCIGCRAAQSGKYKLHLRFLPLGTVKGVVLNSKNDNAPVADTKIYIGHVKGTTDADGKFEIHNVEPGHQTVGIRSSWNGKGVNVIPGEVIEVIEDYPFDVNPQPPPQNATLKISKILKPDGSVYGGQKMWLIWRQAKDNIGEGITDEMYVGNAKSTDADGGFAEDVYPYDAERVVLYVEGYKPVDLGVIKFAPGKVTEIPNVQLEVGEQVEVTVHDSAGKPIMGAAVIAEPADWGGRYIESQYVIDATNPPCKYWGVGTCDETGVAKITALPAGKIAVLAYDPDYVVGDCKIVTLEDGKPAKVDITLLQYVDWDVSVVDADTGEELEHYAQIWDDRPDAQGQERYIHIAGGMWGPNQDFQQSRNVVPPGKHYIIASAADHADGYCLGDFKEGEVMHGKILLKKVGKGSMSGRIVPCDNAPLTAVNYALLYPLEVYSYYGDPVLLNIDNDGRFKAQELQEGVWAIVVRGNGDQLIAKETLTIKNGEMAKVEVHLKPLGSLRVTVLDTNGKPVSGKRILLLEHGRTIQTYEPTMYESGSRWRSPAVITNGNGQCVFDAFPANEYFAGIVEYMNGEDRVTQQWNVKISAGKENTVELHHPGRGTIEGKVVGNNAVFTNVLLLPDSDAPDELIDHPRAVVNIDGTFKFDDVVAGRYRICAYSHPNNDANSLGLYSGMVSEMTSIEVKEGVALKGVEIKLCEKWQAFSGTVANHGSSVCRSGDVILVGPCVRIANVRPDGTFTGHAPAGKYKLYYVNYAQPDKDGNIARQVADVTIEEGKDVEGVQIP